MAELIAAVPREVMELAAEGRSDADTDALFGQ